MSKLFQRFTSTEKASRQHTETWWREFIVY
jgi:hypothetical protein